MGKVMTGTICVIAAVLLSACGSSKPTGGPNSSLPQLTSADARVAATALKQELLAQTASTTVSPLTFTNTQAECTATRVVSTIGTQKLRTYGLLDAQYRATVKTLDEITLSKADATSVVNAFVDCLGESAFTKDLSDAVTSSITGANTAAQRTCLTNKLTVAALKPMLISSLSGDKQAATQFYAGLLTCTKS